MATNWRGDWQGDWVGAWTGAGEGGSASFADMAAIGFGRSFGFVLQEVAVPPQSGGAIWRPVFIAGPKRVSRRVAMAAIGRGKVRSVAALDTDFDVRGTIARRIFMQRRNLALALAA